MGFDLHQELTLVLHFRHLRPADSSRLHASWRVGLCRRVSLIHTGGMNSRAIPSVNLDILDPVLRVRGMSVARYSPFILTISLSVPACRSGIFAMSFSRH